MALKLIGEIALDGSGFERGLNKMGREAASSVKNLAVQAFGIYGIEQAISKTVESANDLVNTSKRLDVTVEQLQILRQAAKDGGTEMDALASAFEKLDIARSKALSGDKAAIAAFSKLGVSQAQLTTQTAATIFTGTLSNSVKNNNVENIAPALKEILGKGFGELIPVLKQDFDELGDKMHKFGSIMDTETAVKLRLMGQEIDLVSQVLAMRLAPVIATLTDWFIQLTGKVKEVVALFGGLFSHGPKEGVAALSKSINDGIADMLPQPVGDVVRKLNDIQIKGMGFDPKDVEEVIAATGESVIQAEKESADELAQWRAKVAKITNDLNNPQPIVPDVDTSTNTTKAKHLAAVQTDALVRVGNFLGANGNTISRVDQRKIDLLTKIEKNTQPKASFGTGMFSSFGIPAV